MISLRVLMLSIIVFPAMPSICQTSGVAAVIDTTAGRLTCKLLSEQRPATVSRFIGLAQGTEPWTSPDSVLEEGKPFYDGNRMYPVETGIASGSRSAKDKNPAGANFPAETRPLVRFDRPGLLAMLATDGKKGPSRFLITDHANAEMDGRAVPFGQCDQATVKLVASMRRTLQGTDNHSARPYAINHIAIVLPGNPIPPPAAHIRAAQVLPPAVEIAQPRVSDHSQLAGQLASKPPQVPSLAGLFEKESPVATSVFIDLADGSKDWTDPRTHVVQHQHRFYDGLLVDRVIPDFYIQFGDITEDISGNTDIGFHVTNENFPGLTFDRPGRLAFGNGGPDTTAASYSFPSIRTILWMGTFLSSGNATRQG